MRGTKAQVLDLGLCSIHTKFHSFILGTSGGNSGLSFILKMGPRISNIFPCLTQFGHKFDLGPCFIQVFNFLPYAFSVSCLIAYECFEGMINEWNSGIYI